MKDAREKAREKAKQRSHGVASSSAFESERQRAAQAKRDEVGSYTGRNVHMIPAVGAAVGEDKVLRVAAYCRVSTDDVDQVISIELQKNTYRDMIKQNPKWKYVGTYVDDGFSGTNTEHRPGFNMMMRDAMDGKIDLIITKAVSRFARNLIDCINWVRRLQKHDPPIAVKFEQENLNTMDNTSNIILFVLAMVAEEESHMKSEAMLLSLEWRFSRGRFLTPPLLGYDKVEVVDQDGIKKKMLVINENQAVVVRYMYYSLLNGMTPAEIAANLTAMGVETGGRKRNGSINREWTAGGVIVTLRNERYCGDVLARKTWTPDFHDHKSRRNDGKKNKYYHPGHHEAIVTRAQWNAAQRILNSNRFNPTGSYKAMRVIEQGALCGYISLHRSWAGFELNDYYRVSSIVMGLEEGELEANLEEEYLPEGGCRLAGASGENGVQRIARQLSEAEQAVKDQLEGVGEAEEDLPAPQAAVRTTRTMEKQFQVVSGGYFTHLYEPMVTISRKSIRFNRECVEKLLPGETPDGELPETYVELLFNPIVRMLAVRPCGKEHPNAVRWSAPGRHQCAIGATVVCKMLYEMQEWSEDCHYRIPTSARTKNDETVLFFDLDHVIARKVNSRRQKPAEQEPIEDGYTEREESVMGGRESTSFYFGAEDEEPQSAEELERIESRLMELTALERVTFGTPMREYNTQNRLASIDEDGAWDVMAQERVLDQDHRVDQDVVVDLKEKMLTLQANQTASV